MHTKTLHAPYDEPVLTTVQRESLDTAMYDTSRRVTIAVTTLMNGTWECEVHHDTLIRLLAQYCDSLAPVEVTKEFLTSRVALTHMLSDRDTGSSIEAWPWVHDLVDAILADALNTGLRLPPGSGPWSDGAFVNVTHVVTEWPTF